MARLDFDLDQEIHARAKAAAALRHISLREYVRQAIAEKLEREGPREPPAKRRSR